MTAPADPELMLAAACCRWPASAARDAAVRAAAAQVQDWHRFGHVVLRQRIAGLVDAALKSSAVDLPVAVAAKIAQAARQILYFNLVATGETTRIVRLIEPAGYPVLAVKGVVLGALAYRSIALKHSKDIDLLILPEHIGAVIALLEADRYRLSLPAEHLTPAQRRVLPRYGKDVSMVGTGEVQLELHWRLFASTTLLPGITARSARQDVTLGTGMRVPTLARAELYAYLVVHGAIHGWARMKWLAEVYAMILAADGDSPGGAGRDMADIPALHASAVALGAGAASAQALLLMRDLFALPLDDRFAAELAAKRHVRLLVRGAYRLMAARDGATELPEWWAGQMLSLAMQPLLGRSLRYQWQIVHSVLYMQPDMYRSSIPPGLYSLYPLVRVPLWLGRRTSLAARWLVQRGESATVAAKS